LAAIKYAAAPVFAVMAILQAVRFFEKWPVTINHFSVPLWASAVAAVAFATLAVAVWRDDGRNRR